MQTEMSLQFQHSRAYGDGIDLSWEALQYEVQVKDPSSGAVSWKTLVRTQSARAKAGRVLAIMGPSGAGKTTMMNSLCGRVLQDNTARLSGAVFLNDALLSTKLARCISFVCQDDVIYGTDTPTEALTFSCRMRTGADAEEASEVVAKILGELGLTRVKDNVVGIPGVARGVSGGERKRTNIGCELVTQPPVIFLDEPTTGLDSETALKVGQLLQELAKKKGRTVITTIHSPSSALYECFDDLLLMSNGGVVYHGPTELAPQYFASVGRPIPEHYNPAEFFMSVLQEPAVIQDQLIEAWLKAPNDPYKEGTGYQLIQNVRDTLPNVVKLLQQSQASLPLQFWLLFQRSMRATLRNPMTTVARSMQTIFVALFVGLFFYKVGHGASGVQDRLGALFLLCVNNVFLALMNGIATFPPERAIFLVEQASSSYSPYAYFAAKVVAEKPFQIGFPILFSCIAYFMIGLHTSASQFFQFAFTIVCLANAANAQGILVAAAVGKFEVAMAIAPLTVLPFMIVGGLFANTSRLDPYWVWLNRMSIMRYAFIGVSLNEFTHVGNLCNNVNETTCTFADGHEVVKYLGFENEKWGIQIMALLIIMFGLNVLAGLLMAHLGYQRRANFKYSEKRNPIVINVREPTSGTSPAEVRH